MTNREIDPPGPVLVTGGNGYVASWVVKGLLELAYHVHATVRDPADPTRTRHLEAVAEDSPGSLALYQADLLDPAGFDRAMAGCQVVFHTASPLILRGVGDPKRDLIEPATSGTRNVLETANRCPSVRRVVLTSSVAAIYGDAADMAGTEAGCFDERHWNETSNERHQPYSYSKTRAERLAWEIAGNQDRWDLVVVNPGLVIGPALSAHANSESVRIMRDFGAGFYRLGAPKMEFAIVDVRDERPEHPRGRDAQSTGDRRDSPQPFRRRLPVPAPHVAEAHHRTARPPQGAETRRGAAQRRLSAQIRQPARHKPSGSEVPSRRGDRCGPLPATA